MPPNILHVSTHDSGRWFGCYGLETVHTPNIDGLASQGLVLEQAFAVCPICSPSRGAAMTGLYPQRNGLLGLTHQGFSLNPDVPHAAQLLRDRGYHSVLFSFQHETVMENWQHLGFEKYLSPENGERQYPFMFQSAPEVARTFDTFLAERNDDRPFYAQVGFNETHTPFWFGGAVPDREQGTHVPEYLVEDEDVRNHLAGLQGALKQADEGMGVLLEALRNHGLEENTLVIFTTDHGIECQRDKWTLYDPGLEIAFILRGPGIPQGVRHAGLFSNVDVLPTLMDLAGLSCPEDLDGVSQAERFRNPETETESDPIFGIYFNGACRCVRTQTHKLIWNLGPEPYVTDPPVSLSGAGPRHARPIWELYDLEQDPHEFHNRAGDPALAETETTLRTQLTHWLQSVQDPCCLT